MLNSVEAVNTINSLVKENTPFLFIIDFEKENNIVLPFDHLPAHNISFKTPNHSNFKLPGFNRELLLFEKNPVSFSVYESMFQCAQHELSIGNSFLLNLTVPTPVRCNRGLYDLFLSAQAKYKLYFQDSFIVFSPECFVTINEDVIKTYPMKGTIRADIPNAREIILNDKKEAAEHATIVDLLRNDLSMVASKVEVSKYRYTDLIQTNFGSIYQVSSEIRGKLPAGYQNHLGEIIFSLLPAGSVTGAPKAKTVSIIKQIELVPREFYTGVFGTWSNNCLDSAVMIRFIRNDNGNLYYQSGGGITFQSNCSAEYKEMIDKVYVPVC
jgi:para-aminobenzoate synthetase component I